MALDGSVQVERLGMNSATPKTHEMKTSSVYILELTFLATKSKSNTNVDLSKVLARNLKK